MYSAPVRSQLPPVFLTPHNGYGVGQRYFGTGVPASGVLGANRITYCPVNISHPVTVYRHFWLNGATASTDNVNVAVYDPNFNRLSIGTNTVSSGASICQFDNVTDYVLGPGRYWLALWVSGTTATFLRTTTTGSIGLYYETNASGPQATGTPADPATAAPSIPVFGLALRATDP